MSVSREIITKARQDYIEGRSVRAICDDYGMTRFTFYLWLDGGPVRSPNRLPPIPRRSELRVTQPVRLSGKRTTVAKHLWRATERQVRELENRLLRTDRSPEERTADLESLLSLVKTYAELSELNRAIKKSVENFEKNPSGRSEKSSSEPKSPTMELSELRRNLACRIAALAGGGGSEIRELADGSGD